MGNWDMPPMAKVESSCEKYRSRVEIAKRFIEALGGESFVNSGTFKDEWENIELSDGRKVTVKLGLALNNAEKHPEDLFRVYLQDESGKRSRIKWEMLDWGDQHKVLHTAYKDGDTAYILGE